MEAAAKRPKMSTFAFPSHELVNTLEYFFVRYSLYVRDVPKTLAGPALELKAQRSPSRCSLFALSYK